MGPPAFAPRPSYPWSPAPRSSPPRSSAAPWSPSAATVHTRGSSIACGQCFCTACARALHMRRGCTARCLDAAVFRRRDVIGAARLRVGGWLGLDGGLVEQDRLRRKVGGG
eukprot:scaffold119812_cov87-Phaeocystis_antarctica.AAC.1